MRSQLAKRQITAEDGQTRLAELTRQRDQKRRLAIRSRPVRQYKATLAWAGGAVQKPSNGYFIRRSIIERFIFAHIQRILSLWFIRHLN